MLHAAMMEHLKGALPWLSALLKLFGLLDDEWEVVG